MGGSNQLKFVRRQWLDRQVSVLSTWFKKISDSLSTETGVLIEVDCPHCHELVSISEVLSFGRAYEITCPVCHNKFTLFIPRYIVQKGLIEEVMYGSSARQETHVKSGGQG